MRSTVKGSATAVIKSVMFEVHLEDGHLEHIRVSILAVTTGRSGLTVERKVIKISEVGEVSPSNVGDREYIWNEATQEPIRQSHPLQNGNEQMGRSGSSDVDENGGERSRIVRKHLLERLHNKLFKPVFF